MVIQPLIPGEFFMRITTISVRATSIIAVLLTTTLFLISLSQAAEPALDTTAIERLTAAKGALDEKEGVFKVSVPRKDLSVTIAGVKMTPPMGLTSWAAFKNDGKDDMVMGDIVMTEDQVGPVMGAALDNGLQVTALHNHFIWDSPRIMFMHIGGMGPEQELATAVGKCSQLFTRLLVKTNESMRRSILRTRRWMQRNWIQHWASRANTRTVSTNSSSDERLACTMSLLATRWA
jgi:hypothetical protein